jgi:uncharacterized protein YkwD
MRHGICLIFIAFTGTAAAQNSQLERDMIHFHNVVRARVGRSPLVWSPQLAARSQEWADALLTSGRFAHHPNPIYGENLFEITGATAPPAQVVNAWASESRDYNYNSNKCRANAMCGHYTQIVWGDTKEVGCAVARAGRREVWVCNYNPPGNWIGQRPW